MTRNARKARGGLVDSRQAVRGPGQERFHEVDTTKAHGAGLTHRPLAETVAATLAEAEPVDGVGLAPEREAELLREWHERT